MNILAVDTSSRFLALGACDRRGVYEYRLETGTRLSAVLVPTIERVIASLGWQMSQIDCLACGIGPGSFTGIRIGMAAVKALAWSLRRPVVGLVSLDMIARNVAAEKLPVIAAVDAKRQRIYCAAYRCGKTGLRRSRGYALLTIDDFIAFVRKAYPCRGQRPSAVIVGDALGIYGPQLRQKLPWISAADKDRWFVEPGHLVASALDAVGARSATDAFRIKPLYLYPKECQIRQVKP